MTKLFHILSKFITRYRAGIEAGLDPEQSAALAAFVTALENIITAIPPRHGV